MYTPQPYVSGKLKYEYYRNPLDLVDPIDDL